MLVVGCWMLDVGCWLLVVGCCLLFVVCCLLFVICCLLCCCCVVVCVWCVVRGVWCVVCGVWCVSVLLLLCVPPVCFTCPGVGRGTKEGAKGCQALVPVHLQHQPGSALPRRVPLGVVRAQVEPPRALRRIREQCPNVTRIVIHPIAQSTGRRRG